MRKKEHLSIFFFNLLLSYGMEVHELKSTWSEISATVSIMYFYMSCRLYLFLHLQWYMLKL